MSDLRIAVLGGTGFIGKHLVCELARRGNAVRVLSRRRERKRDLLVIPGLEIVDADVYSAASLSNALRGCDVVINLVGILNTKARQSHSFKATHIRIPENIAEAARFNRMTRILHMSALNASPEAPSEYLRSKAAGEDRLHELAGNDLNITSFRPSVVFGPGDGFFNLFAQLLNLSPFIFPLACSQSRFTPVSVGNVVSAFANSVENKASYAKRYDLCGPTTYTLEELVRYTASQIGVQPKILPLSDSLAKLQASILGKLPGQLFTLDNFQSMQIDCTSEHNALTDLNIEPQSLESIVPGYLSNFSREKVLGSFRRSARRD
jgi:uncharacterized protein YbjT (DUF2867 family)